MNAQSMLGHWFKFLFMCLVVLSAMIPHGDLAARIEEHPPTTQAPQAEPVLTIIGIDPNNSQRIFVSYPNQSRMQGLFKSADGGTTWIRVSEMMFAQIVFHPTNPMLVYGLAYDHTGTVMKSTDGGNTWSGALNINNFNAVSRIFTDPSPSFVMYVVAFENNYPYSGHLLKSVDGGWTWTSLLQAPGSSRLTFALNPYNPLRMYASIVGSTYSHPMGSHDGGQSWTMRDYMEPLHNPAHFDSVDMDTFYLTVFNYEADVFEVKKTVNDGKTMTTIATTWSLDWHQDHLALFNDLSPNSLYISINQPRPGHPSQPLSYGLNKSIDGGQTWTSIYTTTGDPTQTIDSLVQAPRIPPESLQLIMA